VCVCGVLAGLLFGILGNFASRRRPGRDSVLLLGYIAHMVSFFLIFVTFPADSPLQESEMKPYYTPRYVQLLSLPLLIEVLYSPSFFVFNEQGNSESYGQIFLKSAK